MQCGECNLENIVGTYHDLGRNKPISLWVYDNDAVQHYSSMYRKKLEKEDKKPYGANIKRLENEVTNGGGYAIRFDRDKNGGITNVFVVDYDKKEWFEYSPNDLPELTSLVNNVYPGKDNKNSITNLARNIKNKLTKSQDLKNKKIDLLNIGYKDGKAYLFYTLEDNDEYSVKDKSDESLKKDKDQIKKSIYEMQREKIDKEKDNGIYKAIREGRAALDVTPNKAVVVDPRDSISYSYLNSGLIVVEVEQRQENRVKLAMVNEAFKNDLNNQINLYRKKDKQLEYQRMQQLQAT